jgi:hypothetical protein
VIAWAAVGLIAAAALVYVIAPVRRGRRPTPADAPGADLETRIRAALAAIVDLENEVAVGKLTEPDFAALAGRYESEALAALRALDAARARPPEAAADDRLEREIAAVRARLACPSCGGPRRADGPCARCGR